MPSNKDDLATIYTSKEEQDVSANDGNYVALSAAATKYLIHQFKKLNDNRADWMKVRVDLKSSLAPNQSTVYLQVWNNTTGAWETLDSESNKEADTDFSLYGDLTEDTFRNSKYYDFNNEVAFRVYQLNDTGTKIVSIDLVQISWLAAYEAKYTSNSVSYSPKYPHKNTQDDVEGVI